MRKFYCFFDYFAIKRTYLTKKARFYLTKMELGRSPRAKGDAPSLPGRLRYHGEVQWTFEVRSR